MGEEHTEKNTIKNGKLMPFFDTVFLWEDFLLRIFIQDTLKFQIDFWKFLLQNLTPFTSNEELEKKL